MESHERDQYQKEKNLSTSSHGLWDEVLMQALYLNVVPDKSMYHFGSICLISKLYPSLEAYKVRRLVQSSGLHWWTEIRRANFDLKLLREMKSKVVWSVLTWVQIKAIDHPASNLGRFHRTSTESAQITGMGRHQSWVCTLDLGYKVNFINTIGANQPEPKLRYSTARRTSILLNWQNNFKTLAFCNSGGLKRKCISVLMFRALGKRISQISASKITSS